MIMMDSGRKKWLRRYDDEPMPPTNVFLLILNHCPWIYTELRGINLVIMSTSLHHSYMKLNMGMDWHKRDQLYPFNISLWSESAGESIHVQVQGLVFQYLTKKTNVSLHTVKHFLPPCMKPNLVSRDRREPGKPPHPCRTMLISSTLSTKSILDFWAYVTPRHVHVTCHTSTLCLVVIAYLPKPGGTVVPSENNTACGRFWEVTWQGD